MALCTPFTKRFVFFRKDFSFQNIIICKTCPSHCTTLSLVLFGGHISPFSGKQQRLNLFNYFFSLLFYFFLLFYFYFSLPGPISLSLSLPLPFFISYSSSHKAKLFWKPATDKHAQLLSLFIFSYLTFSLSHSFLSFFFWPNSTPSRCDWPGRDGGNVLLSAGRRYAHLKEPIPPLPFSLSFSFSHSHTQRLDHNVSRFSSSIDTIFKRGD